MCPALLVFYPQAEVLHSALYNLEPQMVNQPTLSSCNNAAWCMGERTLCRGWPAVMQSGRGVHSGATSIVHCTEKALRLFRLAVEQRSCPSMYVVVYFVPQASWRSSAAATSCGPLRCRRWSGWPGYCRCARGQGHTLRTGLLLSGFFHAGLELGPASMLWVPNSPSAHPECNTLGPLPLLPSSLCRRCPRARSHAAWWRMRPSRWAASHGCAPSPWRRMHTSSWGPGALLLLASCSTRCDLV